MSSWAALAEELDRWSDAGLHAHVWWRDDDVTSDTDALRALLRCAAGLPIALAAIPAAADDSLAACLAGKEDVVLFQHGLRHHNHATAPPQSEYPAGRDAAVVLEEFRQGRRLLLERFGARALPVFVPPWHGLDSAFVPLLREAGLCGLSMRGPRIAPVVRGLRLVNAHCAPIAWTSPPRFADEARYLRQICGHLERRRTGAVDRGEPTGILTHHLVQDAASYAFLARFVELIARHPAASWADPRDLFGLRADPHRTRSPHA